MLPSTGVLANSQKKARCGSQLFYLLIVLQIKKTKNVSSDPFGSTLGKLHMSRQDFTKLQTRKMKGLKRPRGDKSEIVKRLKTDQQSII